MCIWWYCGAIGFELIVRAFVSSKYGPLYTHCFIYYPMLCDEKEDSISVCIEALG